MNHGDSFADWFAAKSKSDRDVFARRYDHPFLVWRDSLRHSSQMPRATSTSSSDGERFSFATNMGVPQPMRLAAQGEHALIFPLKKAPGNPFLDRISVGRAPNCDVVLRDPSVSKLHAHFRLLGDGDAVLSDAKSANGTKVNAMRVEAGSTAIVRSLDQVAFGRIIMQFVSAADLYDWL